MGLQPRNCMRVSLVKKYKNASFPVMLSTIIDQQPSLSRFTTTPDHSERSLSQQYQTCMPKSPSSFRSSLWPTQSLSQLLVMLLLQNRSLLLTRRTLVTAALKAPSLPVPQPTRLYVPPQYIPFELEGMMQSYFIISSTATLYTTPSKTMEDLPSRNFGSH